MKQTTYMQKPAEVTREWLVMDATDRVLGQIATEIATKLIGKHKPTYTPHVDAGDYVVVINATKIHVSGNKKEDKKYYSYSGFPGGLKSKSLGELMDKNPESIIEKAVYNMLPDNRLRSPRMNRLKVYAGSEHPHQSQIKQQPAESESNQ